jgi:hypothetical protein
MCPGNHRFERRAITLGNNLDGTIVKIARVAADPKHAGLRRRGATKKYSLDAAAHDNPQMRMTIRVAHRA